MSFQPKDVTDARSMRALAHPVRLALLEALTSAGTPLTATEAAERVGESPSSCSFHLRQLAKYGFVEEAAEGAAGRRRPWRLSQLGLRFGESADDDPETVLAASALERLMRGRFLTRASAALDRQAALPSPWRETTGLDQFLLHVTADELRAIREDLLEVLTRHHDRLVDPSLRPAGARAVEVLALSYLFDDRTPA